jgi:hypothetical protein
LYIRSYSEYCEIWDVLGVASVKTLESLTVAADGFIVVDYQELKTTFYQSPLKSLRVLMSQIWKDGQEIDKTDLNKVLDVKLLHSYDFHQPQAQQQQ